MNLESIISKNIRLALNRTGRVRVVDNEVGVGNGIGGGSFRFGLGVGSPDLVGTRRGGACFCIEVKTPAARDKARRAGNDSEGCSPDQLAWHRAARKWGVFVAVATSIDEAMAALDRAEAGELC